MRNVCVITGVYIFFHHSDMTPLHLASTGGHIDIARLLADRGADIESRDGLWVYWPLTDSYTKVNKKFDVFCEYTYNIEFNTLMNKIN